MPSKIFFGITLFAAIMAVLTSSFMNGALILIAYIIASVIIKLIFAGGGDRI